MSLPSSGAISWLNIMNEMGQSGVQYDVAGYNIYEFSRGHAVEPPTPAYPVYAPINVNSSNNGKYPIDFSSLSPTQFYGYNASATIPANGTNGLLFITDVSIGQCWPSAMLIYDMGTTNGTFTISYNYTSSPNYGVESFLCFFYGPPFGSELETPNPTNNIIHSISGNNVQITSSGSFNYNYVYDAAKGQYIYAVVYGNCP